MEKNEFTRRLYGAILLASGMAYSTGRLIYALTALLPEPVIPVGEFHPAIAEQMRPEPRENFTFILMCLLAPLLSWGAVELARRLPERCLPGAWLGWFFPLLLWWCVWGSEYPGIFFGPMLNYAIPAVPVAALLAWAAFRWRSRRWEYRLALTGIVLLPLLQIFAFRFYATWNLHLLFTHHLDIIAYAVSQAVAGGRDFHQYGLYPYFLAPAFQLAGSGVTVISLVMGILYWTAFVLLFRSVLSLGRGWSVFGAALLLFIGSSWTSLNDDFFDPYFAYYPIRFFFPALGVTLWLYGEKRRRQYPRIDGVYGVFGALAFAWNPDSGAAVTGAFFFAALLELFRPGRDWRRPVFFITGWLGTTLSLWMVFAWKFGAFGDLWQISLGGRYFYRYGFFMLPMPDLPAFWGPIVLIYLGGLVYGLFRLRLRKESLFSRTAIFLAVLGLGLFLYYQGRSHDFTLISVCWPATLLFFLFAGRAPRGRRPPWGDWSLPFLAVFLIVMGAGAVALQSGQVARGLKNFGQGIAAFYESNPIEENTRFLLECTGGRREANIYGYNQGIFYAESGLRAGIRNFGQLEPHDNHSFERLRQALTLSDAPLFLSLGPNEELWLLEPVLPYYRIIARSPNRSMLYLERLPAENNSVSETEMEFK